MMSDPKRLMNFAGNDEVSVMGRELLGSLEPTAADRERVMGRVMVSAGLVAGASATVALTAKAGAAAAAANSAAATGGASAALASSGGMGLAAKVGLALLVLVPVAGTTAYVAAGSDLFTDPVEQSATDPADRHQPEPHEAAPASLPSEPSSDDEASLVAPSHEQAAAERDDEGADASTPVSPTRVVPAQSSPVKKASSSSLVEEDRLLRQARQAAKSGDTQGALAALRVLERRYPKGVLVQERELLKISLLNQAGREELAEKRAEEFRQQYPDSPYDSNAGKK